MIDTYIFTLRSPFSVAGLADSREYCWMSVARWYRLSNTQLRIDSIVAREGGEGVVDREAKNAPRASASSTLCEAP